MKKLSKPGMINLILEGESIEVKLTTKIEHLVQLIGEMLNSYLDFSKRLTEVECNLNLQS